MDLKTCTWLGVFLGKSQLYQGVQNGPTVFLCQIFEFFAHFSVSLGDQVCGQPEHVEGGSPQCQDDILHQDHREDYKLHSYGFSMAQFTSTPGTSSATNIGLLPAPTVVCFPY